MPEKRARGERLYRVVPEAKPVYNAEPEETASADGLLGCLSLIAVLAVIITGIAGLVMGFHEGGVKGGLCMVAAAIAFGLLAISFMRG
jgi:hypothetical protein